MPETDFNITHDGSVSEKKTGTMMLWRKINK